jgi:hypothetical protein
MKLTIFHDANGRILSVIALEPEARIAPTSNEHASIEVDLEDLGVETIGDVHKSFRVTDGRLERLQRSAKRS